MLTGLVFCEMLSQYPRSAFQGFALAIEILSVAMPADSRREKIFDFVREFAVKYFRIVPVRDSTQQNKA